MLRKKQFYGIYIAQYPKFLKYLDFSSKLSSHIKYFWVTQFAPRTKTVKIKWRKSQLKLFCRWFFFLFLLLSNLTDLNRKKRQWCWLSLSMFSVFYHLHLILKILYLKEAIIFIILWLYGEWQWLLFIHIVQLIDWF